MEASGTKGGQKMTPSQQPIPLSEILSPLQHGIFAKDSAGKKGIITSIVFLLADLEDRMEDN